MTDTRCPHCGWPWAELPAQAHSTSSGTVRYRRCVCGSWLLSVDDEPVATVRAAGT